MDILFSCLLILFAVFSAGGNEGSVELRKELSMLRIRVETLEIELKTKEDEIKKLSNVRTPHEERCKVCNSNSFKMFSKFSQIFLKFFRN